jgi:hypothetical protein
MARKTKTAAQAAGAVISIEGEILRPVDALPAEGGDGAELMLPVRIGRTARQPIHGDPLGEACDGDFPKPAELVEIVEMRPLTHYDRRVWNLLLINAWPNILQDVEHSISKASLKGNHAGNDRLGDTVSRLMTTIVKVAVMRNGKSTVRKVQLLGPTDENRNTDGHLYYRFLPELRSIIAMSDEWARIQARVMVALSSKYGLALYEMLCRRTRGSKDALHTFEDFTIERFRLGLGVAEGKMERWQDLRRFIISPAIEEVSALSDFLVTAEPLKTGRSITSIRLSWSKKDAEALERTYQELQRHRAGRKARMTRRVETSAGEDSGTGELPL